MQYSGQVNKIFKITSFVVKHEDERYPSGTGIPFQIFFGGSTVVEALDADIDIPEIPFKFSNLAQIQNAEVKSRVGMCVDCLTCDESFFI